MRILEINKFYNAKRGADKHFLDVIELLEKKGHEVAIFAMENENNLPSKWKKYFVSEVGYAVGYSVCKKIKGFARLYSPEAHRKINRLLDNFRPDLVHIHNIYHQLDPTILFEIKKRKIPVVMTVHDFKLVSPNHSLFLAGRLYDRCRDGKYYQCFLDRCVKNSYFMSFLAMLEMYWHALLGTYRKNIDHYIVPSFFVKKTLIERGIPAEKISVLPHFIPEKTEASMLPHDKAGEKYALYAGSISKEKGVDALIDIFRNISGMKLYLAGKTENNFTIPESENIRPLGYLSQEELQRYIAGASVVVSGSRLPETFGLVALEAIAKGKPFIGFQSGAFPEIIDQGENGFLARNTAEFREAVRRVADGGMILDPEAIRQKASARFGAERYYSALMAVFHPLAGKDASLDKPAQNC